MLNKVQPKSPSSPQNNVGIIERNDKIQKQMDVLVTSFKQYSQQNSRLTSLYDNARYKNEKLLKSNQKLRQDLSFMKDYCNIIESELEKLGFTDTCNKEILSRKETAEGILITIDQSNISQDQTQFIEGYSQIQINLSRLQQENMSLKNQLNSKKLKVHNISVQVGLIQTQINNIWYKSYEDSDRKCRRLQWEVKELKKLNDSLEMEKIKRGISNFIMQDRKQIFNNVHKIIGDYKKKIKQLAYQKKDVQKKYKNLKEKLNTRLDENSQAKLIQILGQKIDVLQKLTQKQQTQIQNTIQIYQVQIKKIEDRRLQQINSYQNARLDLQTENLKLHIDIQKSLNKRDDLSFELMQVKNFSQKIQKDLEKQIMKNKNIGSQLILEKKIVQSLNIDLKKQIDKCEYFSSQLKKEKDRKQKLMEQNNNLHNKLKEMIQQKNLKILKLQNQTVQIQIFRYKPFAEMMETKKQQTERSIQVENQRQRSQISIQLNNSYIQRKFIQLQQKFQKKDNDEGKLQDKNSEIQQKEKQLYNSHVFQKKPYEKYYFKMAKRQTSVSKNSLQKKITITYNQPGTGNNPNIGPPKFNVVTSPVSANSVNMNKTYDGILQYKKKFIQRKPQSSFNL